jgi:imidazolonepropionase-like amidohydrolase
MTLLTVIVWGALSLVLAQQPAAGAGCDASPLLIRHVDVWSGSGSIANRDVLIREGRIAAIGAGGSLAPDRVRSLDGAGHTLAPGLIDAHLHFSVPGGLPAAGQPRTDTADITGEQLLRSGVTSGRLHLASLEDAVRLKARSLDDCAPMPRLQVGGPGLSGAVERDHPAFQGAKDAADARQKVARFGAAGIDWIAVHDAHRFPPDVLTTIASTARQAGVRLMAAGSTAQEITAALRLDPDTLDYFDRSAEPRYAAATLDAMRSDRTLVLVPTIGVPYRTATYLRNPGLLDAPTAFALLAPADREFVRAGARKDLAAADAAQSQRLMASLPEKIAQLRALGLPMAVGSDAGSPLQLQADAIWWELEAWRALGASHREALVAATDGGARVLNMQDVGRLQTGARADFVLYRGDIEAGAFDAARVRAVGKGGVLFVNGGTLTIAAPPR